MNAADIKKAVLENKDPSKAKVLQRFFKTGPGDYGEGDVFAGLKVPQCRKIAKEFDNIELIEVQELLNSKIHEERLIALVIINRKAKKADEEELTRLYKFYLANTSRINNWDLVDVSAEHVVGRYLFDKDKTPLYKLAESDSLWERRIAVLATFYFIRKNSFEDTLKIIELLLKDKHDLIQKACGWMLREIGKRDIEAEENFLKQHYKKMPRTMLRYAIERFPEEIRTAYLKGKI